jgi:hypothetical protein
MVAPLGSSTSTPKPRMSQNKLGEKPVGGMLRLEEKFLNVSGCYSRVIRN